MLDIKTPTLDRGAAGDAVDYALGHLDTDQAISFLEDWRGCDDYVFQVNWPGYFKWLATQREGAREARRELTVGERGPELIEARTIRGTSYVRPYIEGLVIGVFLAMVARTLF